MFEYIHHVAYVVNDMDDALRVFRDTFELELSDHRVIEGENIVEMAAFRCGLTLIEVLRPISHPALAQFLEQHGPGLHHIGFAIKDLPERVEELREKGVFINGPFVAGTGWNIAYFDFEKSDLDLLKSCYHGDHLAEATELKRLLIPIPNEKEKNEYKRKDRKKDRHKSSTLDIMDSCHD